MRTASQITRTEAKPSSHCADTDLDELVRAGAPIWWPRGKQMTDYGCSCSFEVIGLVSTNKSGKRKEAEVQQCRLCHGHRVVVKRGSQAGK